jgi:2-polyprenyl-3-methyl-5-hydroxy-6-metoxy-1,4-benzoquinol methylase
MKILVAIANFGTGNDKYLAQVVNEYRSMKRDIDFVVLSNVHKTVGDGIEVKVGLPTSDPWSLPFAHKQVLADRVDDYDLFIYTEDDMLITDRHIESFLELTASLAEDEIAGFMRFELGPNGSRYFPDVHNRFHWDPLSVRTRGEHTIAFFTNEHAGCYMLTREQLQRALKSGGFLVKTHQGKYHLPETAATDPYTQCGFKKVICISQFSDFLVHHLPNKYLDRQGTDEATVRKQITTLLDSQTSKAEPYSLLQPMDSRSWAFSKKYYEPIQSEVISLIPESADSVLSLGCGWGKTEQAIAETGRGVVAVPLDSVIASCAESRGVELVLGDFQTARKTLAGRRFDCLLVSNMLHLVPDPVDLLASFKSLLADNATVIVTVPNLQRISVTWQKIRRSSQHKYLGNFARSGTHLATERKLNHWFTHAGLKVSSIRQTLSQSPRVQKAHRATLGLLDRYLASELIAVGQLIRTPGRAKTGEEKSASAEVLHR